MRRCKSLRSLCTRDVKDCRGTLAGFALCTKLFYVETRNVLPSFYGKMKFVGV